MDILNNLNCAIAYIENHLADKISISQAAMLATESKQGFIKLFRSLTNMTVSEYIRKRRLSLAVDDLRSGVKVIDVAVKYGWNSADAFSRAFALQHNITPTQARNIESTVNIYPPLSFQIIIKGAEKMRMTIKTVDEFEVYGVTEHFGGASDERFEKERAMWDENYDNIPKRICNGYIGTWYGVWKDGNYSITRMKSDTEYDNLERIVIPGGQYAVFTSERGGYAGDELPRLHELIYKSWLPSSEYTVKSDLEIEVFHLWTDRAERREKRYYEIWISIE